MFKSTSEIFTLEERDGDRPEGERLVNREGYGKTSVTNLFAAINGRRAIALRRLIYALGIRRVGEISARVLAQHFVTYDAFRAGMAALATEQPLEAAADGTADEAVVARPLEVAVESVRAALPVLRKLRGLLLSDL